MGGFGDVTGWDDLYAVTAKVAAIPGISREERLDIAAGLHAAIEREKDVAKKGALVAKVAAFVASASTGGIGAALRAAVGFLG